MKNKYTAFDLVRPPIADPPLGFSVSQIAFGVARVNELVQYRVYVMREVTQPQRQQVTSFVMQCVIFICC